MLNASLFLSGFAGLVYEIVWMRYLRLLTGNTVVSVAAVLAIYMTGLAIGSFLAGRFAQRARRPVLVYGILQGALAVLAVLIVPAIAAARPVFGWIFAHVSSPTAQQALRLSVSALILLLPSTLLGAGLPVAAKHFPGDDPALGARIGRLYAVNTTGAALGAFVTGFLLLPKLGLTKTNLTGVAINAALFVVLCLSGRSPGAPPRRAGRSAQQPVATKELAARPLPAATPADATLALLAVFVSGLTGMVFEVAWTRVLSMNIGTSAYAFSLILSAFITGLALGSLLCARLLRRWHRVLLVLAGGQALIGLSVLLVSYVLGGLPVLLSSILVPYLQSTRALFIVEFLVVLVIMVVPTILLGAMVPMAAHLYAERVRRPGLVTGVVLSVNTMGSVIGSLMAAFVLIPLAGVRSTILAGSLLSGALGCAYLVWMATAGRRPRMLLLAGFPVAVTVLGIAFLPDWNRAIISSGPFLYAANYQKLAQEGRVSVESAMVSGRPVLYYRDGLSATVSVRVDEDGNRSLQIDGKTDASTQTDKQTQYLLAQLPLLMHAAPRTALVVGLGSGITLGSLEQYPLDRIDCIEISEAVVEAAKLFDPWNRQALADPRLRLRITDGRTWMTFTSERYDIITSEPSNPWIAGIGSLFTKEFFESARRHLTEDGVMVQWLHAYSMSGSDFQTVLRTFTSVFPHTTVWEASIGKDYLFVGTLRGGFPDLPLLVSSLRRPETREDLTALGISDVPTLLARLVMDEESAPRFAAAARLNTDDNAALEFSAPLSLYQSDPRFLASLARLRRETATRIGARIANPQWESLLSRNLDAKDLGMQALIELSRGRDQDAFDLLQKAYSLNSSDPTVSDLLVPLFLKRGNALLAVGDDKGAAREYQSVVAVSPLNALAWSNLGSLSYRTGGYADARGALERAVSLNPYYGEAHVNLGETYIALGLYPLAREQFQKALELDPRDAHAHNSMGVTYERLSDVPAARKEYEKALSIDPRYTRAQVNLGNSYFLEGDYLTAIRYYRAALQLDPAQAQTYYNLGAAYYKLGRWSEARGAWTNALRIDPEHAQAKAGLALLPQDAGGAKN